MEPRTLLRENKWGWEVRSLEGPGHAEDKLPSISPALLELLLSLKLSCLTTVLQSYNKILWKQITLLDLVGEGCGRVTSKH